MFWLALDQILTDKLSDLVPHYIKVFCECLLHHNEPAFIKGSEVRFITNSTDEARKLLKSSNIVTNDELLDQQITILNERCMTKQVPIAIFREKLAEGKDDRDSESPDENIPNAELSRLMECISVKEIDGSVHLLCDDPRSLMRTMYNSTLVILRSYEFPKSV